MEDENENSNEGAGSGGSDSPLNAEAISAIVDKAVSKAMGPIAKELDKRWDVRAGDFGRQLSKVKEKVFGSEESAQGGNGANESANGVQSRGPDASTLFRLGQAASSLPEKARELINSKIDAGEDPSRIMELIEWSGAINNGKGSEESQSHQNVEPGQAGTPAQNSAGKNDGTPRTQTELMKLQKDNPKQYERLMSPNHPFDPTVLPYSIPK